MPIPSQTWYPTSLPARAPWHGNFSLKAQAEGADYGLSVDDVSQIVADAKVMSFLLSSFVALDTYEKAWTAYRNGITVDAIGTPQHEFPDELVLGILPTQVPTGIFQRTMEYRDIVIHSLNYTKEVGQSWGIEPSSTPPVPPVDVQPTIKVTAAATNYHFSIVVSGRGSADSFKVFVLRSGAAGWVDVATGTGKSLDVHLTPQTPGLPEQLQVRVQCRRNNQDYGQPSDPVYVTINP